MATGKNATIAPGVLKGFRILLAYDDRMPPAFLASSLVGRVYLLELPGLEVRCTQGINSQLVIIYLDTYLRYVR